MEVYGKINPGVIPTWTPELPVVAPPSPKSSVKLLIPLELLESDFAMIFNDYYICQKTYRME